MKKRVYLAAALVFCFLTMNVGAAYAAPVSTKKDGDNLVQEFVFFSDTISNVKSSEARDRIEYEGKEYELSDVSYKKIGRKTKVTRVIDQYSKEGYPKSIKAKNYEGKTITLTTEEHVSWEEIVDSPVIKTMTYTGSQNVPGSIQILKDGEYVTAIKTNEEKSSKRKNFTAPAVFYGETDDDYLFNGKYVNVGDNPTWAGYERDVKDYLNDPRIRSIESGRWTGERYRGADGRLVRKAVFTGTKEVPVTKATYTETKDSRLHYRAVITYHDPEEDGEYVVKAVCTYKPYKEPVPENDNLALKMLAGAGVLIIAAAVAAALIYLASRKRMKKNPQQ